MGRAKQKQLPQLEDAKDEDLTRLADEYVEARDERMAAGKVEVQKRDLLSLRMKEKNITRYEDADSDILVVVEPGVEKLKVKKLSAEDEDPSDE